jgi:hypothetical protein
MGVEYPDTSSRSSCDDDDDPEAALNPSNDDDDDNVAPLFRLRRLARGQDDVGSAFLPGAGHTTSVYVTMHRYGTSWILFLSCADLNAGLM